MVSSPSTASSASDREDPSPAKPSPVVSEDLHRFNFSLKLSQKLDEKNFHLWRQQVEPFINAHGLTEFVVCTRVPPRFLTDEARNSGSENPAYSAWLQKDQMLLSWLQSTLSGEILSRMLGCTHAHELWDRLFQYFQKQTRARARQLRVELRAMKLDSLSV
ncbi:uncharacterized protein LOC131659945 [Vicia villosa]|uniref:uncharacterized protein LOC131659945 n=1 Tax=Vicia villosa TaxID=3911 RepID=UPI00273CDAA8|nr:uncharacterized protein LOC131659945 [Vicia villosa]